MRLSPEVLSTLDDARRRARGRRQMFCSPEQTLESLLLMRGALGAAEIVTESLDGRQRLPFDPPGVELSKALRNEVFPQASEAAAREDKDCVEPEHVLAALLRQDSPVSTSLREEVARRMGESAQSGAQGPRLERMPVGARGPSSSALQPLEPRDEDRYLVDRPALVEQVLLALMSGSPLLVGPAGAGRRSLIRLVARKIRSGRCPRTLAGLEFVELDPTRLIAGTTYRGELEERAQCLVDVLTRAGGRQVVVVEDLHLLAGSSKAGGAADLLSILVPHLRKEIFRVLGCITHDFLRERLESHTAFLRCLTPVAIDPPKALDAGTILAAAPEKLKARFDVGMSRDIIDEAVSLCSEHVPHLALPGSAETLLRGAAALRAFEAGMLEAERGIPAGPSDLCVERRHLLLTLSRLHRIPANHLESGVEDKIRGLENAFRSQIFGQDHVLPIFQKVVKVALMSATNPRRPRGRLFLLGPPGTGKTECARLLARHLMGSEEALLRFDMSEFSNESSVSTLLGSDKGLVQSEEGGRLTEPVRQNPHRVILFDEIEKADRAVFDLFLQILDNASIRDKRGNEVSFRHTICLFTSNAGCDGADGLFGATREQIERRLAGIFRKELLDRMETFVPFKALDHDSRTSIAGFQLERMRELMRQTHRVDITWDQKVIDAASCPPEGEPGGRHVLRFVQSEVAPAIVDCLLAARREESGCASISLSFDGSAVIAVSSAVSSSLVPAVGAS